jgi:hypothetical protein
VFQDLGQVREALPLLQRSLARSQPRDSIVRKLYALIVQCHRHLGEHDQALAACRAGQQQEGKAILRCTTKAEGLSIPAREAGILGFSTTRAST